MTTTALLPLSVSWAPILPVFSPAEHAFLVVLVATAIVPVQVATALGTTFVLELIRPGVLAWRHLFTACHVFAFSLVATC
jgi:hypothetical protein